MKPISLQQLATMAQGLLLRGNPVHMIQSAHFDTRQLEANSLFIAIQGEARDGHDFIQQAIESGATAALISDQRKIQADLPQDFGLILVNDTLRGFQKLAQAYRNTYSIPFIAVTGSNGKTTTKDIMAHVLGSKVPLYKTYKNFNNHLGVPYSLLQLDQSHQAAVLELGMNHAGEIDLLASLVKPAYSVITNIGDAHIEFFHTREKIALAKAELLPHTDPARLVLLNGDNEYLRMVAHLYPGKTWFYSVTGPADIWAEQIVSGDTGTNFVVKLASGVTFDAYIPLFGTYNVSNCLPAIAIALEFGLAIEEIQEALATVAVSGMRFELVPSAFGTILVNDAYNASPFSMKAAIETFATLFPDRKKVLVLGDIFELGSDSAALHTSVGEYINRFADAFELLVTVGENSRQIHEAYAGNKRHFAAKEEAVPLLAQYQTKEYAMLFKASRGMKLETLLEALKG